MLIVILNNSNTNSNSNINSKKCHVQTRSVKNLSGLSNSNEQCNINMNIKLDLQSLYFLIKKQTNLLRFQHKYKLSRILFYSTEVQ